MPNLEPPRILFLFSDTGGGHRSAAEAVIEAINLEYGSQIRTEMVDIFKDYAPRPLNRIPAWYPGMVRIPQLWELGYRMSDGHRRARVITGSAWPYVRRAVRSLVQQHPSDLIVSLHALANAPVLRALKGAARPPFVTIVTDLVSTHALWYHRQVDLCIVPTEEARQRALRFGLHREQVEVIGLPVADRFCTSPGSKSELRAKLGWQIDRLVVLVVGGGDGMGPLGQTARAIAAANLPVTLAVITGRNAALKAELESINWNIPTFIYGFVRNMPELMNAADVLVTKAGPGTISEALNASLPMVLYSRLPGQEDGNVAYLTDSGAGVWAPKPQQIVHALQNWIDNPAALQHARATCKKIARPQAARQIARLLVETYLTSKIMPEKTL
ncbi:MAG: glycosyltransferase [Anaerolineales bacterium]